MRIVVLFVAMYFAFFAGVFFYRAAFWKLVQRIEHPEEGQALIEYALIIILLVVVAIVALETTGVSLSSIIHSIAGEV